MSRRAKGEGSIRRLANGRWSGQLMDGFKDNGKKRIICFSGATRAEVLAQIRRYQQAKEDGLPYLDGEVAFSEWAQSWYEDYKTQVQPSTYENYRYTLKTLTDYFGRTHLNVIKQVDINYFIGQLTKTGCSASKVSKCKAMLVQIFEAAVVNDLLAKNPAAHAKVSRRQMMVEDEAAEVKDAFTEEEVEILSNDLPDNLMGNSIMLMIGTGLRTQELLALGVKDIAEDGSTIRVNKAIKMVGSQPAMGPPKSRRSRRMIPVPEEYRMYARFLRCHGGRDTIWVSYREDGLYSPGTFRKQYYKVIAGLPAVRKLTPHCCRHTYVTRLQARGVPMELIARLTGHADIRMTDHYAHANDRTLADMVALLNHRT